MSHPDICPLSGRDGSERWELRTSGLGCNVSTRNFLSVVATVFITIVALVLMWGFWKILVEISAAWKGVRGGWEVKEYEDAEGLRKRRGGVWVENRKEEM
ncbi:hypothetical protein W97_02150 [Coniosporium apollinis CBS 100218]|uniref:Uncharacterized protein n=1 Tax=Coniosporium apollinis (strain CBS 100218) TaxID=1168221 RepID=R7YM77_CONA1|nr:uncharacterized protein W97_02150 [Coniosporium apollinis CBS 100218]EON62924.1 hypothetical protein W97_02150 [Coniosporium apollinis CBS 100218]